MRSNTERLVVVLVVLAMALGGATTVSTAASTETGVDGSPVQTTTDGNESGDLPAVGENESPPTDLDGDGLYEDVNGNGEGDLADAVDLFQHRESDAVRDDVTAYDFSGNDEIDLADVVELFQENTVESSTPTPTEPPTQTTEPSEPNVHPNVRTTASIRGVDGQFDTDAERVELGQTVQFDATESNDPDGEIESYEWTVEDVTNDTYDREPLKRIEGPRANVTFPAPGTYVVTARAVDDEGEPGLETLHVVVHDPLAEDLRPATALEGNGTADEPYEVDSLRDLRLVNRNLTAHYELVDDVDAGPVRYRNHAPKSDPLGFDPIGDANRSFTGTFDGNGHVVSDLYVNRQAADRVGLFGAVGENGTVERVGLENVTINYVEFDGNGGTVDEHGIIRTGGLVGYNAGTVRQTYVTGTIRLHSYQDEHYPTGGLVGENVGTISESYADMDLVSDFGPTGGLAGVNEGRIESSYSHGIVEECYASQYVGDCERRYALVGDANGTVVDAGHPYPADAERPRGDSDHHVLDTGALTGSAAEETLGGYGGAWRATADLPVLAWEYDGPDLPGAGTASGPYEVDDASDLREVRKDPSARYVLTDDVDASASSEWNDGTGFRPIGTGERAFTGTFDGDGHEITDPVIERPDGDNVGLFGRIGSDGRVTNVSVTGATVTGNTNVGVLAGDNAGTVTSVVTNGTVDGEFQVGGLVGRNDGTVSDARAAGSVVGEQRVGGLAGTSMGTVETSLSVTAVDGESSVGGLLGRDTGAVDAAYWDANASGTTESARGTALSTDALTGEAASDSLDGFDFGTEWITTDGYPAVRFR